MSANAQRVDAARAQFAAGCSRPRRLYRAEPYLIAADGDILPSYATMLADSMARHDHLYHLMSPPAISIYA